MAQARAGAFDPKEMGERIRKLMTEKGLKQNEVEERIGASSGYLSRLLSGKRGSRITPEYLRSIATVLDTSPNYLRYGKELENGAVLTPIAGLSPQLEEIDGFRQAEFAVSRLEPKIPFGVFEAARKTRMNPAPQRVTVEYLRDLVRFLANYSSTTTDETDAIKGGIERRGKSPHGGASKK